MIKGIGIDIVSRSRFDVRRTDQEFISQILQPEEISENTFSNNKDSHIETRFALKEATMKALGCGLSQGSYWHDIEVTQDWDIQLSGYFKNLADKKLISQIHSSYSVSKNYVVALVVLES